MLTIVATLATLLLQVIILFGIGVLADLISHIAFLTAKALLTKIRDTLAKNVGGRIFISAVGKIAREVEREAERTKNVQNVHRLLKELEGKGVVMAGMAPDGTVDNKSIQILKAEEIDDQLDQLLQANQYELIMEA